MIERPSYCACFELYLCFFVIGIVSSKQAIGIVVVTAKEAPTIIITSTEKAATIVTAAVISLQYIEQRCVERQPRQLENTFSGVLFDMLWS